MERISTILSRLRDTKRANENRRRNSTSANESEAQVTQTRSTVDAASETNVDDAVNKPNATPTDSKVVAASEINHDEADMKPGVENKGYFNYPVVKFLQFCPACEMVQISMVSYRTPKTDPITRAPPKWVQSKAVEERDDLREIFRVWLADVWLEEKKMQIERGERIGECNGDGMEHLYPGQKAAFVSQMRECSRLLSQTWMQRGLQPRWSLGRVPPEGFVERYLWRMSWTVWEPPAGLFQDQPEVLEAFKKLRFDSMMRELVEQW